MNLEILIIFLILNNFLINLKLNSIYDNSIIDDLKKINKNESITLFKFK